jgi:hypothetical protein
MDEPDTTHGTEKRRLLWFTWGILLLFVVIAIAVYFWPL